MKRKTALTLAASLLATTTLAGAAQAEGKSLTVASWGGSCWPLFTCWEK